VNELSYTLVRSSRKTVALQIRHDGTLLVRAPLFASKSRIDGFILQKRNWIEKKRADLLLHIETPVVKKYTEGELFLFMGISYPLEYDPSKKSGVILGETLRLGGKAASDPEKYILAWYKKEARTLLESRIAYWSKKTKLKYSKMRLSGAKTRWGSCTSKGVISLNWRLVMAPLPVLDYVVIHELVHTEVYNHTAEFWREVGRIIPDYKELRGWLKAHRAEMILNKTGGAQ
jgi:hypothetical protein